MTRSTFIKVAAALGVVAGLSSPASAQVSTGLLQQGFGGAASPTTSAFSALKNGGSTTQTSTGDGTPTTITTGASGGKTGTFSFNGVEGDSQRFAVGTSTSIGVNASASSTSEYSVKSSAALGLGAASSTSNDGINVTSSSGASNFKQSLGSSTLSDVKGAVGSTTSADGAISGTFKSTETTTPVSLDKNATNDVTVKGLGNTATINADPAKSSFTSNVERLGSGVTGSNSATANGSAGGSVNSSASADASRSSFSSIFMQSF